MRKWTVAFLAVTISALLNAAPSAKGPASGSLTNVSVIHVSAAAPTSDIASEKLLPQLSPDDVPAFNDAADGQSSSCCDFRTTAPVPSAPTFVRFD